MVFSAKYGRTRCLVICFHFVSRKMPPKGTPGMREGCIAASAAQASQDPPIWAQMRNKQKKSEDFSEELFQNLIRKVSNTNKVQRLYLL